MSEKDEVIKEKLEFSGIFDYVGMYSFIHAWFSQKGIGVTEEEYSEKVVGKKRDIKIKWIATKKVSDYYKAEYEVKFRIEGLSDVEVEVDRQKRKMNEGKAEISFTGVLIIDPESKWEGSNLWRFFREVYNKYIVPARINGVKDKIEENVRGVKEETKAFLDVLGRR